MIFPGLKIILPYTASNIRTLKPYYYFHFLVYVRLYLYVRQLKMLLSPQKEAAKKFIIQFNLMQNFILNNSQILFRYRISVVTSHIMSKSLGNVGNMQSERGSISAQHELIKILHAFRAFSLSHKALLSFCSSAWS
jgi:hypothetical protein